MLKPWFQQMRGGAVEREFKETGMRRGLERDGIKEQGGSQREGKDGRDSVKGT